MAKKAEKSQFPPDNICVNQKMGNGTPESTLKSTLKGTRKAIIEIIETNPNVTLDQIAEQLGLNPQGIDKHIKKL